VLTAGSPRDVPPRDPPLKCFATASRGTEEVLARELTSLGIEPVEVQRGGVAFGRTLEHAYRACLGSRVASRVLMPLARFDVTDAEDLYEGVHGIDWTEHLGADRTLAVDAAGGRSPAGPRHFVALKTKDAIVDRIRAAEGARPSVDTSAPDVRVNVHLHGPSVIVNLDLSGGSLHRRGFGRSGAAAPLKENLAAAVLLIAGWPERSAEAPLLDPFCGSGTLLFEAAWMALDVAPGLLRDRIGAERWRGHEATLWSELRREARERADAGRERRPRLAGTDASPEVVNVARSNLKRAGLAEYVQLAVGELKDARPPWPEPGLVVTNPPYGERLGEVGELVPLYELLGDVLKRHFPGWCAWVLTGSPALGKRIGLRPASRHVLYNGPIESRLIEIPIADRPVTGDKGPGWRKPSKEAASFARRLEKNRRRLSAWARRENLTCYRMYDADMPEYNLAVDWYDGGVRVEEHARPRKVRDEDADRHLREAMQAVPEVLGVDPDDVVLRVRQRSTEGRQHERRDDQGRMRGVREGDLKFLVNLTDYLDTGLFLDDRLLRRWIRERVKGVDFLNLFAYTCAASVAAVRGGARSVTSVDMSNRYLEWGKRNFALNGLDVDKSRFIRADVLRWLEEGGDRHRRDLVFLAPPTYSRSKTMRGDFDVQRDHVRLLEQTARLLKPGGAILFSTNLRGFVLDLDGHRSLTAEDITKRITPEDFARRPRLKAFVVRSGRS
jgi:23S rRNA (guanine2445-N2)-methyltransferase / 23S rRNA (guanine2069-N7)-methyltransferase